MNTCGRCEVEKMQAVSIDDSMEVAGHVFMTRLPAERCPSCGDVLIDARYVKEFERAVVLALARSGQRSGRIIQAMRKGLSLSVTRLAEVLDVPAANVSAWEEGAAPVPNESAAMLRALVVSQISGRSEPLDGLGVLRQPQRLGQKIRLHLRESIEKLSFGSMAMATA